MINARESSGESRGGALAPILFLDQSAGRNWDHLPPPPPLPPPLIWGSGSATRKGRQPCNREAWGNRLRYFGRAVENGGKFQTFCEEETADVLPTNSKNTTQRLTSAILRMVDGRLEIPFYPEFAEE